MNRVGLYTFRGAAIGTAVASPSLLLFAFAILYGLAALASAAVLGALIGAAVGVLAGVSARQPSGLPPR